MNWFVKHKAKKLAKEKATKEIEKKAKDENIKKEKEKIENDKREVNKRKLFDEFNCFNYPDQYLLIKYKIYYDLCLIVKGSMNGGYLLADDYRFTEGRYTLRMDFNHTNQLYPFLKEMINDIEKHDKYYGFSDYYDYEFVKRRLKQIRENKYKTNYDKETRDIAKKNEADRERRASQAQRTKILKCQWDLPDRPIRKRITDKIEMGEPTNLIDYIDSKFNLTFGFGFPEAVPYSFIPKYYQIAAKHIPAFEAKLNDLSEEVNSINDYNQLFNEIADHIKTTVNEYNVNKLSMLYELFYNKQTVDGKTTYVLKDPEIKAYHDKYHYLFANEATDEENNKLLNLVHSIISKHIFKDNEMSKLLHKVYRGLQATDIWTLNKYSNKVWTEKELKDMPIKEYKLLMEKTKRENFEKELEEKSKEREKERKAYLRKKEKIEIQRAIDEEKRFNEDKRRVKESLAGKLIDKSIKKVNDSCNYPGVYLIVNNNTLDFYIGESQNLAFRRLTHLGDLIDPQKNHSSSLMQKHFNQYGANCLDFYVLEKVDDDTIDGKARKTIEAFYIKEYKPTYNSF